MKKIILAWAIFLAPASSVLGQQSAPADTGTVVSPHQESPPADTGAVVSPPQQNVPADTAAVPPPTDTGATAPQQPTTPADTGSVAAPPSESTPADTGTIPPQPADTIAIPPQPADTGTVAPPAKSAPADTATVVTPRPESPPVVAPEDEEEKESSGKPKQPNRVALGIVFNDEAPISIRAWFNQKVGLDAGIGLRGRRVDDSTTISDSTPTPTQRVGLVDLSLDLGLPIRVVRKEKVDFIIRPGFGVRTRPAFEVSPTDPSVRSIEIAIELEMNGSVGFEYYPYEKVSFSLQAGLALILRRTGGDISNSIFRVQTLPSEKGVNFTFRYYAF